MATTQELQILASIKDDMSSALKLISENMQGAGNSAEATGAKFQTLKGIAEGVTVGIAGFTAATAAFIAGQKIAQTFKEAVGASADFDKSLTRIKSLVGVNAEQVAVWREQILQLAPALGQTPKDMSDALFFITSSGIDASKAMGALVAASQASSAGLGEIKTVADVAHSAMNAYGQSNLSAADAVGILVAGVREGKVEASALAGTIGRVLPIAAAAGVGFRDVVAAIASMTRTGETAAQATTSVLNFLTHFISVGPQAAKALHSVGLSHQEILDVLQKKGLLGAMDLLASKMDNDKLRKMIQDQRALAGVLSIVGPNAEHVAGIFERIKTAGAPDLAKAFGEAAQTSAFNFEKGVALINVALIRLGDEVMPTVLASMGHLIEAFNWFFGPSKEAADNLNKLGLALLFAASMATVFLTKIALGPLFTYGAAVLEIAIDYGIAGAASIVAADGAAAFTFALNFGIVGLFAAALTGLILLYNDLSKKVTASADAMDYAKTNALQLANMIDKLGHMTSDEITAAKKAEDQAYATAKAHIAQADAALKAAEAEVMATQAQQRQVETAPGDMYSAAGMMINDTHAEQKKDQAAKDLAIYQTQLANIVKMRAALAVQVPVTPQGPVVRPPLGPDEAKKGHKKKDEVQAEIDALTVEAAKYKDVGEQADFLSALKKAGLKVQLESNMSIEAALAIMDKHNAAYRIAQAVVAKYDAEIAAKHDLTMQEISAGHQIAELAGEDARQRDIDTAKIKAQTEAVQKHLNAKQLEILKGDEAAKAAAKYDDTVRAGILTQEAAIKSTEAFGDAYIHAATLGARAQAIENAGLAAYQKAIEGDADAVKKGVAAQEWANAAKAAAIKWDQANAISMATSHKAAMDQVIALTALGNIRAKSSVDLVYQTTLQNTFNAAIANGVNRMNAEAAALQAADDAVKVYVADSSHLVTIHDAINELNKESVALTPGQIFKDGWTGAFDAVGQAANSFFSGQAVGWRQLAANVLASIAAMIIKMLVMKAVMAGLKLIGLGDGGAASSGINPFAIGANADGNAYTNQIVNSPTLFKFAGGSKMGVMGEAGPEAIMPLTRMSNGKLGVHMDAPANGGGGGYVSVQAPVVVNFTSSGDPQVDSKAIDKMSATMGAIIEGKVNQALLKAQKQGGVLNTAFSRGW